MTTYRGATPVFLIVLPLLLGATPLIAQPVQLSGWVLPEGTTVCGTGEFASEMEASRMDWDEPLTVIQEAEATACFEVISVSGGRIQRATETMTGWDGSTTVVSGSDVLSREPSEYPLLDKTIAFERKPDRWATRFLEGVGTDEEEALIERRDFELDQELFPERPVSVGQVWEVRKDVLEEIHGYQYPGAAKEMRMRLDSLGVWDEIPAAFMSYELEILNSVYGLTLHAEGELVRSLDTHIDLYRRAMQTEEADFETDLPSGEKASGSRSTVFHYEAHRRVIVTPE